MTLADFNCEIDRTYQAAWHAEKGGDQKWGSMLAKYGATPLTDQEKEMLLNSEIKIVRGAFPIELRRVYEKIISKYSASNDNQLRNALNNFNIDDKTREYYQKIKPFTGLGDIFSNATVTQDKYSAGMQKAKHHTIKCKSCGSPRLEEMQYDMCLFCGSKLFENAN